MSTEQVIRGLRAMLCKTDISQDEHDTICAAIRALGGNP